MSANSSSNSNGGDGGIGTFGKMNSFDPSCQQLKDQYDACFNNWFSNKFLKGLGKEDDCAELMTSYTSCVKAALTREKLDWSLSKKVDVKDTIEEKLVRLEELKKEFKDNDMKLFELSEANYTKKK